MPSSRIAEQIRESVRSVLASHRGPVALHEPQFCGHEEAYVLECIRTGWVSSVGSFVDRFEAELAAYTGVRHVAATCNGTAALHVALLVAGVRPLDEVLLPTLTFVATANAVSYCGAIPHFVDSSEDTLGLDPVALATHLGRIAERKGGVWINRETRRRISVVVPMHAFGHPVDVQGLQAVCEQYGLIMVEDAAESLGSTYGGVHTGNFGRVAAVSFNGNKIVTTGGGGAIMTNDPEYGRLAKHLTTTARIAHRWEFLHDAVGYNYRLPNINAALGCAQLETLPTFLRQKRTLAGRYKDAFARLHEARFVAEPPQACSNYWLNTIVLSEQVSNERDEVLQLLHEGGFLARPCWTLMHKLPMYADCPRAPVPVAESLERRLINLPSSAVLAGSE